MNGDATDQANKEYTIEIPGMLDIFRIPILEKDNVALRQQRAIRMRTEVSPLPQKLQWIPTLINHLDDAQDMLITGLTLAKPILKKLPLRFVPYLGWALLINDILNLTVGVLGAVTTGPRPKAIARDMVQFMGGNRLRKVNNVKKWLSRTNWFGFSLQAGQVSQTLTGYGLSLGGVMGAVSDTVWGGVRALGGAQVKIKGPPPADPLGKAYRFLHQSWTLPFITREITPEDHLQLYAANAIAQQLVNEQGGADILDIRADTIATTQVAVYEPWNEASRTALTSVGIPWEGTLRNPCRLASATPTYQQATSYNRWEYYSYEQQKRSHFGLTDRGTIAKMLYDEAGVTAHDTIYGAPGATSPYWDLATVCIQRMIEFAVFPPDGSPRALFEDFFLEMEFINELGRTNPTREDLILGMFAVYGGWQSTAGNYP